jgi:pimeloyl-ACP methyl ester carboxylesterase
MSQDHDGPDSLSVSRRKFVIASGAALAAIPALPVLAERAAHAAPPHKPKQSDVVGSEHWTTKVAGTDKVKLFLWRKRLRTPVSGGRQGTILFVHGSSISATPAFDLQIPGRPECSVMDWFARKGYDTWCVDCEGYGRSDKTRPVNSDVSCGADDLAAATTYITKETGGDKPMLYGESSGGLRVALFAQRHPEQVKRVALDAFVWTGEGSPTLTERRKKLAQFRASNRRPIDRDLVRSIFTRDHPGTSDQTIVEAFADAVLALDNSAPTGTYVDMSANLPLIDPEKLNVPTLILRGQFDGIATFEDLSRFFAKLPNPDKQFIVMPGIAHSSMRSKNWAIVYHLLDGYFSQPAPVYVA